MGSDKAPVGLILLGLIAAFLVLRLRSILGKREGFEGSKFEGDPLAGAAPARRPAPMAGPVIEGVAEKPSPAPLRHLPEPGSAAGLALAAMQKLDKNFAPAVFLNGAEGAFRLIVAAFAAGDRAKLRPLLAEPVFAAFDQAIAAREAAGQVQRAEIRSILESGIEQARLEGSQASIRVRFVSHQIAYTQGPDGSILSGADAVTELVDVWEFQRDLGERAPAWRLAAAESA